MNSNSNNNTAGGRSSGGSKDDTSGNNSETSLNYYGSRLSTAPLLFAEDDEDDEERRAPVAVIHEGEEDEDGEEQQQEENDGDNEDDEQELILKRYGDLMDLVEKNPSMEYRYITENQKRSKTTGMIPSSFGRRASLTAAYGSVRSAYGGDFDVNGVPSSPAALERRGSLYGRDDAGGGSTDDDDEGKGIPDAAVARHKSFHINYRRMRSQSVTSSLMLNQISLSHLFLTFREEKEETVRHRSVSFGSIDDEGGGNDDDDDESIIVSETLHYIETLDEYTDEELDSAFYSCEEMLEMKDLAKAEGKKLDRGLEDQVECRRGLEVRTKRGCCRRYMHRKNSVNAVLDEQRLQRIEGTNELDWELIEYVYEEQAIPATKEARKRGLYDEREALEIVRNRNLLLREVVEQQQQRCRSLEAKAVPDGPELATIRNNNALFKTRSRENKTGSSGDDADEDEDNRIDSIFWEREEGGQEENDYGGESLLPRNDHNDSRNIFMTYFSKLRLLNHHVEKKKGSGRTNATTSTTSKNTMNRCHPRQDDHRSATATATTKSSIGLEQEEGVKNGNNCQARNKWWFLHHHDHHAPTYPTSDSPKSVLIPENGPYEKGIKATELLEL